MLKPKFSVIIPVYNCENYITRCIDSVLNQSYSNFELICVDDCSTDSSLSILHKYAEKDKRITVIESEVNTGGLGARKKGVYAARGEYIIFIDSDDYVKEGLLSFADKTTAEINKDIIQYSVNPVIEMAPETYIAWLTEAAKSSDVVADSTSELLDIFFVKRKVITNLWGKIFRTEMCRKAYGLLEDLQINTNRGEDVIAFFAMTLFADGFRGVESEDYYFYMYGLGSSNYKNKTIKDMEANCKMADACIQMEKYVLSEGKHPEIIFACRKMAERLFTDCCRILNTQMESDVKEMSAKVLVDKWYDVNIDESVWIARLGMTKEQFRSINNRSWFETIKSDQKIISELEYSITKIDKERETLNLLIQQIKSENSSLQKHTEMLLSDNHILENEINSLKEKKLLLEKELKRKNDIYYDVTHSVSFKIGRLITWIPRKVKQLLKTSLSNN